MTSVSLALEALRTRICKVLILQRTPVSNRLRDEYGERRFDQRSLDTNS